MGTNIIHLADFAVPSYRRARTTAPRSNAGAGTGNTWSSQARHRVASRTRPAAPVCPAPVQTILPLGPDAMGSAPRGGAVRVTLRAQPLAADGTAAPGTGPLRISGRLIDVCAELERLAALEAAQAQPRRA